MLSPEILCPDAVELLRPDCLTSQRNLSTRCILPVLFAELLGLLQHSQLGVILTVLFAELLGLLQHLAQLGFVGSQGCLARLYQHVLEQLCGFNECLLGIIVDRLLSVISKLVWRIFTLNISFSTLFCLLLAVLFCHGFLGPDPWLVLLGFSGPNPWLVVHGFSGPNPWLVVHGFSGPNPWLVVHGFSGPNPWLFLLGFSGPDPWLFDFLLSALFGSSFIQPSPWCGFGIIEALSLLDLVHIDLSTTRP